IGLQTAALFSTGTTSRLAFLQSRYVVTHVPGVDSIVWWPAKAVLGEAVPMLAVVGASIALFVAVVALFASSLANFALLAAGTSHASSARRPVKRAFIVRTPSSALRHKERLLLLRDPWLLSQSLMQILYLIPPALLLMKSFGDGTSASIVLVPVLIMAAGQLAGGLAWLTISGEDAPELMGSSPLLASRSLRAKTEAVLQCVGVVFLPLVLVLGFASRWEALVAGIGIAAAAMSSSAIQFWFRSQASRSQFRRRHTSSRIATLSEAFVSIAWAGAGAVAANGGGASLIAAAVVAVIATGILFAVRSLSPSRTQPAAA
ncbi:MAG: permease, partial [Rhizomicrobium sp.]